MPRACFQINTFHRLVTLATLSPPWWSPVGRFRPQASGSRLRAGPNEGGSRDAARQQKHWRTGRQTDTQTGDSYHAEQALQISRQREALHAFLDLRTDPTDPIIELVSNNADITAGLFFGLAFEPNILSNLNLPRDWLMGVSS
jgi:hypothetical protein